MRNRENAGARSSPALPKFLNETEVAEILGITVRGVQGYRRAGGGPPWTRVSKNVLRYNLASFQAWIATRPSGGERLESLEAA
ncbi:MAG: helix-turn-helix domain-containing protein [Bryobacteraceae bacterium]|jgi:hypothetical protein